MSGLAALFRFDGGPVGAETLRAMTGAMAYRGPDGITQLDRGNAGFGFCAMHTMAESLEAEQPLTSEDSRFVVLFDGFLANHAELRRDLTARGERLRSAADAELVLHAFTKWGADFVRELEGEFALVVWDSARGEAWCARDHHGLRPLYWCWDGQTLVVASEIAAVLAALAEPPEVNRGYLAEVAADLACSPDETVWRGVMRLLPAHVLHTSAGGPQLSEYWSLPREVDILYAKEEDYFEHYLDVLEKSVRSAARSRFPVACEVSGGLDSSSVFGLAHRLLGAGKLPAPALHGYTLAAPAGSAADEVAYARLVAAHIGTSITECPLFLPELEWFAQRAAQDRDLPPLPNAAMSITLDETAVADGCRVSMTGVGGDQWLDGTNFYYGELLARRQWRTFLDCYRGDIRADGFFAASFMMAKLGPGSLLPARWRRGLRRFLASEHNPVAEADWLLPEWRQELAERYARHEATYPEDFRKSYKLRKLQHPSWSLVLDQASRQRAQSGLEMRSPMMSRAFIEFSARTPEQIRLRGGVGKYIHRRAMAGILPKEIMHRQTKAEFSVTYEKLAGQIRDECLDTSQLAEIAMFDQERLTSLFNVYRDAAIDERINAEIWGVYANILIDRKTVKSAERERFDD